VFPNVTSDEASDGAVKVSHEWSTILIRKARDKMIVVAHDDEGEDLNLMNLLISSQATENSLLKFFVSDKPDS